MVLTYHICFGPNLLTLRHIFETVALDMHKITPEEVWTGKKPHIEHLRVFGCDAYALIKDHQHKLHPKGEKCILVGYEENSKAYRLWNHAKHKIIISRNVKFNELI